MPGVTVETTTRSGPSTPVLAPTGQFFVAGMAARGSTTAAQEVTSIEDFERLYGGRTTYSHLYDTVKVFFEEGGANAWIVRVVGPDAVSGSVSINDSAYSPAPTLKFSAANPGNWSDTMEIVVSESLKADCVNIAVVLDDVTVESHKNLDSVEKVLAKFYGSPYVIVEDLGSVAVAPDNLPALGTFTITGGDDDRDAADAPAHVDALDLFGINLGVGAVSIPGFGVTVHVGIDDHCKANNRVGILSMDVDSTTTELKTQANLLNTEYCGLFAPWVEIPTDIGGVRQIPPDGYIAGVRNRAHGQVGPWRAAAGQIAVARYISGLVEKYDRVTGDDLDEGKVNAIREIAGTVRNYGYRSLSDDTENYSFLGARDLLNMIVYYSENRLEQFVFETIEETGALLSRINGTLTAIVENIRARGGLFERLARDGSRIDPGYLVETGPSINNLSNLAQNIVKARVSVRMTPTASLISVEIVKVGLLGTL